MSWKRNLVDWAVWLVSRMMIQFQTNQQEVKSIFVLRNNPEK